MIVRRCLCGILTGLLWLSILVAAAPTPNPTVTLDAGVVVGTAVTVARQTPVGDAAQYVASQNGTNGTTMSGGPVVVNEFLGIPYAQSPPLRFAPPTAAKPWSSPIDASQYKPVCTQEFIGMILPLPLHWSSIELTQGVMLLCPFSITQEESPHKRARTASISTSLPLPLARLLAVEPSCSGSTVELFSSAARQTMLTMGHCLPQTKT